ncbi:MAG: flagellar assembly protein FliW [Cellulosilyticum sp.]|nr:flagellar assembly protein FliW [Cellulosilyticum sp.]
MNIEEIKQEKIITFEEGIPGFEYLTKFIILENPQTSAFLHLQSLEDENICFIITDPYRFKQDYAPVISEVYFDKLGGGKDDEFAIYTVVCLQEVLEEGTINLAGPLLIHTKNMKGIQVITEDRMYRTKHRIVDLLKERRK